MIQRAHIQRNEELPLEYITFRDEVLNLLQRSPKELSPKFFYNKRGLDLFNQICELPSYYLARTSLKLMETYANDIVMTLHLPKLLFEYGGGNSRKIRILLSRLKDLETYVPIDVCREHLLDASVKLTSDFPNLKVVPACIDYMNILDLAATWPKSMGKKVCFFPGSTIGNLLPQEALQLMRDTQKTVAPDGGMLVGVDLKKDIRTLEEAYDDPEGVTSEFNLNILARLNDELGANFDLTAFRHRSFYNHSLGRIEMHLESLRRQTVTLDGHEIPFLKGETIHTENSYKYSIDEFQALARDGGFHPVRVWIDENNLYSIHYLATQK